MTAAAPPGPAALLTDQVYAVLYEAVINGAMPAGTRLRVRHVAARMGTSIMPVREAIRRLEESGLAEREPHKGAVVKGFTLRELIQIYDIRLLLETGAARSGVAGLDGGVVRVMAKECDALRAAARDGRVRDALDHDEALLTALYGAGGNPFLMAHIRDLWHQCRAYKVLGAAAADRERESTLWQYQSRLVEAARAGDADTAAALTRDSLLSSRARIQSALDEEAEAT